MGGKINRGIIQTSVPRKKLARILDSTLREHIKNTLEESQYDFQQKKSTQDLIFTVKLTIEKSINKNTDIHMCFLDFEQAFGRIISTDVWKSQNEYNNLFVV